MGLVMRLLLMLFWDKKQMVEQRPPALNSAPPSLTLPNTQAQPINPNAQPSPPSQN